MWEKLLAKLQRLAEKLNRLTQRGRITARIRQKMLRLAQRLARAPAHIVAAAAAILGAAGLLVFVDVPSGSTTPGQTIAAAANAGVLPQGGGAVSPGSSFGDDAPAPDGDDAGNSWESDVATGNGESPTDPQGGETEPSDADTAPSEADQNTGPQTTDVVTAPLGGGETTLGAGPSAFDNYSGPDLVRIEEDWELVVIEPDVDRAAPQIATIMSPFGNADSIWLSFVLNHRFNPYESSLGGIEVQLWNNGTQLGWRSVGDDLLSTAPETVRWTQRLELQGTTLRFVVVNGTSTTWSTFGEGESLHLAVATNLTNLNAYRPAVSLTNSGITYASHRVASLVLKQVRGYDAQGNLVVEDTAPVAAFAGE